MNLTIHRKSLHTELQAASRAVTTRSSLPILGNVKLEAVGQTLRITATDLELAIERALDGVNVTTPGGITLPAKTLCDIVGNLPDGEVSIALDGEHGGTITCGKSVYRIHGLPVVEYPPVPTIADPYTCDLGADILRRALKRTMPCVSKDDTRPVLTGVLIEIVDGEIRIVATDTHRLAVDRSPFTATGGRAALVPGRAIRELAQLLPDAESIRCEFGEDTARFIANGTTLTTRLIAGQFPKWERVVPTSHNGSFTVEVDALKRAVKRASVVARENVSRIGFCVEGDTLLISAEAGTLGSCREEVALTDCSENSHGLNFYLNAGYLVEVLDGLDVSAVTVSYTGPLAPFVLRGVGDEGSLTVVMPMNNA